MKISEITIDDVGSYLKVIVDDEAKKELTPIMAAAKSYISSYTGIPVTKSENDIDIKTLDDFEDFYIVFMVLCQDMYDNRTLTSDSKESNRVVSTILNMHCVNGVV